MANVSFLDRFPFCVLPAQEWDGETAYLDIELGNLPVRPSASSEFYSPVFGQGTRYPVGFTLDEVVELYWRIAAWEVKFEYEDPGFVKTTLTFPYSHLRNYGNGVYNTGAYGGDYFYEGSYEAIPESGGTSRPADDRVSFGSFNNINEERGLLCLQPGYEGLEGEFVYASEGYQYSPMSFYFEPDVFEVLVPIPGGESGPAIGFEVVARPYVQQSDKPWILAEGIPDLGPIHRLEHEVLAYDILFVEMRVEMFQFVLADGTNLDYTPPILFDESSGLYYPQFSFAIGEDVGSRVWSSTKPYLYSGSPVGTVDFFGKSVNVYPAYGSPPFSHITFSLTPKYWWPYDGGSGPTYDVNTGSPL